MRIIAGSASGRLANALSNESNAPLVEMEYKRFPDGECYVRIMDDVSKEDLIVVVQTTYPDPNIIEFMLIQDAIRNAAPSAHIVGVIPYMGYSRQDKLFLQGEGISARAIIRHIEMDCDAVVFVDLHSPKILEFTTKRAVECTAMGEIARFFKNRGIDFVLSPDKGAVGRAERVARELGLEYDYLEKTRIDGNTVKMAPKALDVDGKTVLIVDDIISTGGTIIKATESLRESGAKEVYAACTHGLYTSNAIVRLKPILNGLYSTDTIESETSVISAARPIAKAIRGLQGGM